jgi:(2Fe-2S) ferredoxin
VLFYPEYNSTHITNALCLGQRGRLPVLCTKRDSINTALYIVQ